MHAKLLMVHTSAIFGSVNHTGSSQQNCEIAAEVALSPGGVEALAQRFASDFGTACPLHQVPTPGPAPRQRRGGSTTS